MKIAIIEYGHRNYLMDTFDRHPEFDAQIVCFAEYRPKCESYQNIKIISLDALKNTECDVVLVAVSENDKLSKLLVWLHDQDISNVLVLKLFTLQTHSDFIAGTKFDMFRTDEMPGKEEKPYLVHLETHVCDQCNLNCKACNNFSPFVKGRQVTDVIQYERDMQHLAELFSNIGRLFLLGGEPLLEPELCCDMIRISKKYFPRAELRVLTNATLLLKMEPNFWECLREYHVILQISVYPPIKNALPDIIEKISDEECPYIVEKIADKFYRKLTHGTYENVAFNYEHCASQGCHYLREGNLSKCPDAILIGNMASAMDQAPEKLQSKCVIKLSDTKDSWKILRELNQPIDLCKTCSFQRLVWFPWETTGENPDPEDWFIESRLEYENRELTAQIDVLLAGKDQLEIELEKSRQDERKLRNELDEVTLKYESTLSLLQSATANRTQREIELEREWSELRETNTYKFMMKIREIGDGPFGPFLKKIYYSLLRIRAKFKKY